MIVIGTRFTRWITIVDPYPSLTLLVVYTRDDGSLFTTGDIYRYQLTFRRGSSLTPSSFTANFDSKEVDSDLICVLPSFCSGMFATNLGTDCGCVGLVTIGNGVSDNEPPADVWEIRLGGL
jgi:hypothetical protein